MIELHNIHKTFYLGGSPVYALRGISLSIQPGELIAILGPSGSGKSTLMHILGLLDVPDSGSYQFFQREVSKLKENDLAEMRHEEVGFVFQQFNLLSRMTALENVSLPLIYSGRSDQLERAVELLKTVGLGDRIQHKPSELSGGQQQRVAIARSMVNHPRVILADEPTGNLDSASKKEIMDVLKALNAKGITVIIVTHEEEIGREVHRQIRMRDGKIESDIRIIPAALSNSIISPMDPHHPTIRDQFMSIAEHFRQGIRALAMSKVRTALSILGILIGVSAVVAMIGLGQGASSAIKKQLSSLGSNLLVLRSGTVRSGGASLSTGSVTRLTVEDVSSIRERIPQVKSASPSVADRGQVTYLAQNWNTQILGVTPSYAEMHAAVPVLGRFFTEEENQKRSRVAVIGLTVARSLFEEQNPIGNTIKINKVIFQVIGLLPEKGANGFRDQDDIIIVPVFTAMRRLSGKDFVDSIDIEVIHAEEIPNVQKAAVELMISRHKVPPSQQEDAFQIHNMADVQDVLSSTSRIMSVLLAVIAAISLLVGGIGIMNIMLVSVTERTREIGLRKAIGARGSDILYQFLIESVIVSALGGLMGIALGWVSIELMKRITGWPAAISTISVVGAFVFSATVGIVFGLYPARKASQLNPIQALRHE